MPYHWKQHYFYVQLKHNIIFNFRFPHAILFLRPWPENELKLIWYLHASISICHLWDHHYSFFSYVPFAIFHTSRLWPTSTLPSINIHTRHYFTYMWVLSSHLAISAHTIPVHLFCYRCHFSTVSQMASLESTTLMVN